MSNSQIPQPIKPENLTFSGDIAVRSLLNYSRLEGKWYRPWEVFGADQHGWPADWEGRIILALVSQARATHREPAWLEQIIDAIPAHLNKKGYFGPICPEGICDEQQLAGHSWLLRGLVAYAEWKGPQKVGPIIEGILKNLVLPTLANYPYYPLTPADLSNAGKWWQLSKLQSKGKSHALSSDLGCAFILLDGVTDTMRYLKSKPLKTLARVMIDRFLKIDLEALHVQTHATLTSLRGVCRFAELTGDEEILAAGTKIFDRYKEVAMTEHYANYNWWGRPRWTEPCAVIDSFILANWLWRLTGEKKYLADAHHIYHNGVAHAFRSEGCFGTDWCLGAHPPAEDGNHDPLVVQPRTYEVYWCCTMRGGELFGRACEAAVYTDDEGLVFPHFHNVAGEAAGLRFEVATSYPVEGKMTVRILAAKTTKERTLKFFLPPWKTLRSPKLRLNGKAVKLENADGFAVLRSRLRKGDVVEYEFGCGLHVAKPHNKNTVPGVHSFRHGPMLLVVDQGSVGEEGNVPPTATAKSLGTKTVFEPLGDAKYRSKNGVTLTPIFDIRSLTEPWHARQGLFESC